MVLHSGPGFGGAWGSFQDSLSCSSSSCGAYFLWKMLTPPIHPDADSGEDSPAPHRATGYRLAVRDDMQLSQLLFRVAGHQLGEVRVYSFQSGSTIPFTTRTTDLPIKVSIQVWNEDLASSIETALQTDHVPRAARIEGVAYQVFLLRKISQWELWDNCSADFSQLDRRITQLQLEVERLRLELAQTQALLAGSTGTTG